VRVQRSCLWQRLSISPPALAGCRSRSPITHRLLSVICCCRSAALYKAYLRRLAAIGKGYRDAEAAWEEQEDTKS